MDGKTCLVRAVGRGRRERVRTPDLTFLASLRATWWGFSFVFISLLLSLISLLQASVHLSWYVFVRQTQYR